MKVLTSTVMFAFGYPISQMDIARKIPQKESKKKRSLIRRD